MWYRYGAGSLKFLQKSWLLLGGLIFGVRLLIAVTLPTEPAGDETYYWEWGRHLDWGYFSKPPGIAWLMALLQLIGADTTVGFKVAASMLGTVTALAIYGFAQEISDRRAATMTLILFVLTPAALVFNLLLTIDALLFCSWAVALWMGWRLTASGGTDSRAAWLLGIALAIGYLSKQMMLAFPVLWVAYLASSAQNRGLLLERKVLACLFLPLSVLLPPIWWNWQEGWVTFEHTRGHLAPSLVNMSDGLANLVSFLGSQALILTPVTFFLLLGRLRPRYIHVDKDTSSSIRQHSAVDAYLWMFSAPALLAFSFIAVLQPVLPNWSGVFWIAAFVALGRAIGFANGLTHWTKYAAWVGGVLTVSVLIAIYVSNVLPLSKDPLARVRGWATLAAEITRVDIEQWPQRTEVSREREIVVFGHRYFASQLAFHHPERPFVDTYQEPGAIRTQYGVWQRQRSLQRRPRAALVIIPGEVRDYPVKMLDQWPCGNWLQEIRTPITPHSRHVRTVQIFRAQCD